MNNVVPIEQPYPDTPSEKCPECDNPATFWGVTVYHSLAGKPSVEIYYCEDHGEFEIERT